jgi:hypothetical protein
VLIVRFNVNNEFGVKCNKILSVGETLPGQSAGYFVKRGMERSRDKKTAIPLFGSEWQSLID